MSDQSKIEWTDATWNPTLGCSKVSEGCRNCYAMLLAGRFNDAPEGHVFSNRGRMLEDQLTNERKEWTGNVRLMPERLGVPLRWRRPRRVFVDSMSDLFHEKVPEEFIAEVWFTMARAGQHTFQVLTKRPERARDVLSRLYGGVTTGLRVLPVVEEGFEPFVAPNVWLGTSVENQAAAEERIPYLLRAPAVVRFLSCEPLLGPLDLSPWVEATGAHIPGVGMGPCRCGDLSWVIVGGESGPGARPFDVAWARGLVAQCRAASVPVFVKQLGARPVVDGTLEGQMGVRDRKGGDPEEEDVRVREFPEVTPRA